MQAGKRMLQRGGAENEEETRNCRGISPRFLCALRVSALNQGPRSTEAYAG